MGVMTDPRVQEYVDRVVAQAPPLTTEQRDRIAGLLRTSPKPEPERSALDELMDGEA